MAAPLLPLALYPDFRMAMLNWTDVTSRPIKLVLAGIRPNDPPQELVTTMSSMIGSTVNTPVISYTCGNFEFKPEKRLGSIRSQAIMREPTEGVLSPRRRIAITCVGNAFNQLIAAAYKWETESNAADHDVDAMSDLGEAMVNVINKMASMFNIPQQYSGGFSPPCWSPRWDRYIKLGRAFGRPASALEIFTGELYDYAESAMEQLRAGMTPTYPFSALFMNLIDEFLAEDRADAFERKAVQEDEKYQLDAYYRGKNAAFRRKQEVQARQAVPGMKQRPEYPTRAEREYKTVIPDVIEVADFTKTFRSREDEEEE
jgi:hypothetical protein